MSSLPPKIKILSIQAKDCSKIEIELSRKALFHTNTKACLMYSGQDCSIFLFFFFFRQLSTILLIRHFLFLNVTYAKIFVRYEIFIIGYFVTFSLRNILNISCRSPYTDKRFEAELFSHTTFSFLIK